MDPVIDELLASSEWKDHARMWAEAALDLETVLIPVEAEILWLHFSLDLGQTGIARVLTRSQQGISKSYRSALTKARPSLMN